MIVSPIMIVALNINGGGAARVGPLCAYLDTQHADIFVLTEWRDTAQGREIADWATRVGLHCAWLADGATANGVFLAAKTFFTASSATPRSGTAGVMMLAQAATWTVLACYFPHKKLKPPFFAAVARVASAHADEPLIVIGDLNTGYQNRDRSETGAKFHCTKEFDALSESAGLVDLWRLTHGSESREYSWVSAAGNGFRIDHGFANDIYVRQMRPVCHYDHDTRLRKLTDHSALIVTCGTQ